MSDEALKVMRSRLSRSALDLLVTVPQDIAAASIFEMSIIDIVGRRIPVTSVMPVHDDGSRSLSIGAIVPDTDPDADSPSYLLSVGRHSTWFAPASPRPLLQATDAGVPPPGAASIDYLGRDYTHFMSMMRSRVSQIVEDDSAWALDHPADPMTTILGVLAYAGDHLSFRQDAAGTESYLTTARRRLSLRRHARLRDYAVNDGCNARTALVFAVNAGGVLPAGLQVVTLQPGQPEVILPANPLLAASSTVFETLHRQTVSPNLNDLGPALVRSVAYTIPAGAISLTLQGADPGLVPGQLIVLRQLIAPDGTGTPFGAQVLRLLKVEPNNQSSGVTTLLSWHPEDALTASLTVPPAKAAGAVSLYGNVVLADHGQTVSVPLHPNTVPAAGIYAPMVIVEDVVSAAPPPRIDSGFDGQQDLVTASLMMDSAAASLAPDPRHAVPCVAMSGARPGLAGVADAWAARLDLLSSASVERSFAVTLEDGFGGDDRNLRLRFGDGELGYAPAPETVFTATARIGLGQSGRVRANALLQVIGPAPLVSWVTNPLPAAPFVAEETQAIRLFATTAFRTNERGIKPADWDRLGRADPLVSEVHATVGADGFAPCVVGLTTNKTVPDGITFPVASARLMRYAVLGAPPHLAEGVDTELDVALIAYCTAGTNIGAARERLLARIGTGSLPDGSPAFFNPVNWPMGRPLALDELVNAIKEDSSVSFVVVDPRMDPRVVFRTRHGDDDTATNIVKGSIVINAYQRLRVGNDGFHPDRGSVRLYVAVAS